MASLNSIPSDPAAFSPGIGDNEATIISGSSPEDIKFSNTELRRRLGIPEDEKMANYKNLHAIGLGGVGAVYAGNEPGTDREVAIKILRPQYRYSTERIESFVREVRATAQIDHPNVIPVYRFGVFENEGVYFSMKRVRGETLRNVLRKLSENRKGYSRKYTLRRLINIFIGACNGVAFANKNGIFHGDLKPGNIMIGEFGEVLVMDWGMARYRPEMDTFEGRKKVRLDSRNELRHEESQILSSSELPIGGTPVFMAPEHLTGEEKNLTETSEVYALGTILYSILTWKAAPYDTDMPREKIIRQVVKGRFQMPRKAAPRQQTVPRELEAICCKAMHKNPKARYQNVSAMIDELQNYLDGYPVRAYSPSPFYRMGKWFSRHPLIPVTVLALGLGVGGFRIYTSIQENAEMQSRFRLAQYNADRSALQANEVRASYRKLKHDYNLTYDERFNLYRNINKMAGLMSNSNAIALTALAQLPRSFDDDHSPRLILAREIFRRSIMFYRELGDNAQLQETVANYRRRWGTLFLEVLRNDPELLKQITQAESHQGTLTVELPKNWQMEILTSTGNPTGICRNGTAKLQLPEQNCIALFSSRNSKFSFPVKIHSGKPTVLAPGFPESIPDNLCYIGSGEIPVQDLVHARPGGDIPPFMISKYEVSVGEYLKFWKSLPPEKREKFLPMTSISADGKLQGIWDKNGKLRSPYHLNKPVTGISREGAAAYCAWLGRKLRKKISLPTAEQWQKAAFRFPEAAKGGIFYSENNAKLFPAGAPVTTRQQDISAFGVVNARGNVREMLSNLRGRTTQVTGGSFLTPESAVDRQQVQFTISGDNDIGFRYVVEL